MEPATAARRLRLLVGKVGLDGHDRGAKIVARAFRDAGFEVIYTGLHQSPEMVVETAIQEDVDAISLSILSGAHNYLFPRVIQLLRERDAADIAVFGGGIVPDEDVPGLRQQGVLQIFTPGASTEEIVRWVREHIRPRSLD
ncbi:MAG TPA: cobalamin B12-binding domain-containing protein [Candidatus Polarisedimenticolaceae bacterium]|nr:cobalamin B12-binding domain-containing protein [Candidatus Polarisedimenticolaceae bacterium]